QRETGVGPVFRIILGMILLDMGKYFAGPVDLVQPAEQFLVTREDLRYRLTNKIFRSTAEKGAESCVGYRDHMIFALYLHHGPGLFFDGMYDDAIFLRWNFRWPEALHGDQGVLVDVSST